MQREDMGEGMTDKDLADRLVELGIGFKQAFTEGDRYTITLSRERGPTYQDYLDAESWLNDWRVAGACLEGLFATEGLWTSIYDRDMPIEIFPSDDKDKRLWVAHVDDSLPRAIIEAYIEAVSDES